MQDGRLWIGDNAAGGEIWLLRNKHEPRWNIEEAVSIRAVRRVYAEKAGIAFEDAPEPKDVYAIGRGDEPGPRDAAIEAFRRMGEAAGDALATAITLVDGLVVIGGGLTGASSLFLPAVVAEMNATYDTPSGSFSRMEVKAFDLEDPAERAAFVKGEAVSRAGAGLRPQGRVRPAEADRRRPLAPRHEPRRGRGRLLVRPRGARSEGLSRPQALSRGPLPAGGRSAAWRSRRSRPRGCPGA